MTFAQRLKTTTTAVSRLALGAAMGLGLVVAIAGVPAKALAQAVPAPAAEAPSAAPALRAVPQAQGQGPAMWVIRDADSTIYLFGTVHVLRPTTAWGTARVDSAFASADEFWMEISNPDDQAALIPIIQQHGLDPANPLSGRLTAEEFAKFDEAAKTLGASGAQLDAMRPWLAALQLSMAPLVKAGYDPQSGVELVLKARAEAAGKPIKGFETLDQQIRILADMPEDIQLAFLRSTLEDYDEAVTMLDGMVTSWSTGDVDALDDVMVEEMKTEMPQVYDALLTRRNQAWTAQIQELLAGSGTVFIAVGAAHLVGDDSVQSMLEDRGIEVDEAS
jgi:uncharacterized protein YbaP (TraB family)